MKHFALSFSIFLLSFCSTLAFAGKTDSRLERNTEQGAVIGFESNENTISWHGIPYASPPINELRWRAPQPPEKRNSVLVADDNSALCPQVAGPLITLNALKWNKVVGEEDCLYINITAPADLNRDELLPVMFWIHGGGNSIGSKGNRAYTGEVLSAKGRVILVTVNYRLGPLGWFNHPALLESATSPEDRSGNFGTLDLIQALHWLNRNISNFGGDPGNITVFGESAGGANTLSLLLSPLAENLFHRAIVESGGYRPSKPTFAMSLNKNNGHPHSGMEIAKNILEQKKLSQQTEPEKLLELLRQTSPEELISLYPVRAAGMLDWPGMIADGHVLPDLEWEQLFMEPNSFNTVPTILGTNKDENKTFMALDPEFVKPGFIIRDREKYNRTASYLSNSWKVTGVDKFARGMSNSNQEVYAYRFDWDELPNLGLVDLSELIGAGHGLEIPFVFGSFKSDFNIHLVFGLKGKKRRQALSDKMLGYWVNFAYSGSPNTGPFENLPIWKPWSNEQGASKFIILDAGESAIKMSSEEWTEEKLKQQLAQDKEITDQSERCKLFKQIFVPRHQQDFDLSEYQTFAGGCS